MRRIDMKRTGINIKLKLRDVGLLPTDIARALDVSTSAVWKWVNGHSLPRVEKALDLCDILGCTIDELLVYLEER